MLKTVMEFGVVMQITKTNSKKKLIDTVMLYNYIDKRTDSREHGLGEKPCTTVAPLIISYKVSLNMDTNSIKII